MDEIEENELGEVPVNTCHIEEEYEDDFEEDVDEDHKFDETGSLDAFEDEIETLEWNSATDKTGILDVPIVEDKVSHNLHQETLLKESKTNLGDVVEQEAVLNADDDKDDNDLINDIDDVVKHKAVDNADDDNDLINDIDDVVKHKVVDNDLINNVVEQEVIVDNGNALIDVTDGVVAINSDNTKKDSLDEKQDTVHVEQLNGIDEIEKSSDSDEANIAEIYGATLAYIDDQSESVSEKDDLTSNDTMDAVDREKDFEELACFTPREDKPNGNVVNHDTEHVESYEQNLADVYGETLARIETTESPVDEKKIEDIFRYQQSIGDSAEILTADEKQDLAVGEKSQLMDEDIKDDTIKAEIQSLKSMCENTEDKEAVIDDSFTSFVVIDDDVAGNQERFAVSDEEVEMGVECLENKSYVNTPECTPELNIDARNITVRKVRTLESVSSDFAIISCSDPSLVSHDIPSICDFEKESEVEESFCNISLAGQTTDSATIQDLDVSFNSTCEDSSNIYATPDSSLNYGDTFFESLDKTDRTSTMSTEHSSRPESVISLENIDCINEDLNISIMSTDSDSNDSIRETLEMYAKELEYQSTRDAGGDEDTLPRTPGDESKLFPTVELKDQRNNVQSRDEMETKTKNEMETKTKNEMEIRTKDEMKTKTKNEMEIRTKDEMKIGTKDEMPILEVKEKETQKTKKKHQKKKMHVDSFDDIFVKENRSAEVVNKKSDKARTEKKVKGKAKKYVASDVNDESSAAKCDTLSAKGDTVYKGTAKAKVEEKRKESESALKYRPLPVAPSALKGAVKSDEGGVTKSKTPKHEIRKEKKTFDQLPSKKGSRDSSPVVTVSPGDKEVEFNKSPKKAGKKLSSTGKACGSADGKSPKSPKERKGNTLKKLKDEIKKIDLDGKSKSPSKSKPDTSLVKESSKSKMNNKKKNENTREKSPEKKVLAPLAKLDMSDDLLSDDCVLMDQPSVKPKVQTSGSYKPRPLPPRPDTKVMAVAV
uniref:Muscle M-line assembly protein unc-89-like n=1 Tax=Saccoglossus kowalevskii TaxID=10224 RepID=A0ABM0LY70_SACKO|nr:PREDICTED: muscle M-line assembly protein unc-89-like [Saccoglossus kowalevskii]